MAQSPHSSNQLLASLRPEKMAALLPHLKIVELPQETVLYESGDPIKAVYFPHEGIVSLVIDLATGEMIEVAMVGRDSVVGSSAGFDLRSQAELCLKMARAVGNAKLSENLRCAATQYFVRALEVEPASGTAAPVPSPRT